MVSFYGGRSPYSTKYTSKQHADALNALGPITADQIRAARANKESNREIKGFAYSPYGGGPEYQKKLAESVRAIEIDRLAFPERQAATMEFLAGAMQKPENQKKYDDWMAKANAMGVTGWNRYDPNLPGATAVRYTTPATPEVQQNYSDSLAQALGVSYGMSGGGGQSMGGTVIDNSTGNPVQPPQNPSNAFLDGLNANLANYDSYTVNSDLAAAEQSLRDMLVNAQNYNADASTIGRIQMALDDIGRLGQDRTRQQGIIDQARRDAQSNLTNFGTSYTDVDYRNAQALDSLSRQLDQITNPNLDVELNYDFSDLAGDVDPYREVVQNMRARRMRELNALGEDIGGIGNSLEGFYSNVANSIPDGIINDKAVPSPGDPFIIDRLNEALNTRNEDGTISDRRDVPLTPPEFEMVLGENGFLTPVLKAPDSRYAYEDKSRRQLRDIQSASEVYDIRDRLNEALNSLDVYGVGSRANELRRQIFNQDEIYGQLADQLRGRQGQIETDAQAQLDALAEARLTRPDDIRSFEEALRDLSGQRDLFDAATAADELERLTDQVQRARSDLERDEAARIARQQLERMRALQTQGAAGFNNNYMTADDYSAYLRALEMGRNDQYFEGMGTSFSRALGLA